MQFQGDIFPQFVHKTFIVCFLFCNHLSNAIWYSDVVRNRRHPWESFSSPPLFYTGPDLTNPARTKDSETVRFRLPPARAAFFSDIIRWAFLKQKKLCVPRSLDHVLLNLPENRYLHQWCLGIGTGWGDLPRQVIHTHVRPTVYTMRMFLHIHTLRHPTVRR